MYQLAKYGFSNLVPGWLRHHSGLASNWLGNGIYFFTDPYWKNGPPLQERVGGKSIYFQRDPMRGNGKLIGNA